MEKNNNDMEDLMKIKELMENEDSAECNDKKWDRHDRCENCGKVNIFTRNVYLSINCCHHK